MNHRNRVMLRPLEDVPARFVTCELDHHHAALAKAALSSFDSTISAFGLSTSSTLAREASLLLFLSISSVLARSSWIFLTALPINCFFLSVGLSVFDNTISRGACAAHIRGIASVTLRDTLMISRVDTLHGSVTMIMNRALCGISRKNILDTEQCLFRFMMVQLVASPVNLIRIKSYFVIIAACHSMIGPTGSGFDSTSNSSIGIGFLHGYSAFSIGSFRDAFCHLEHRLIMSGSACTLLNFATEPRDASAICRCAERRTDAWTAAASGWILQSTLNTFALPADTDRSSDPHRIVSFQHCSSNSQLIRIYPPIHTEYFLLHQLSRIDPPNNPEYARSGSHHDSFSNSPQILSHSAKV